MVFFPKKVNDVNLALNTRYFLKDFLNPIHLLTYLNVYRKFPASSMSYATYEFISLMHSEQTFFEYVCNFSTFIYRIYRCLYIPIISESACYSNPMN